MVTRQPASVARSLQRSSCQGRLAKLTVLSRATTRSCCNAKTGRDLCGVTARRQCPLTGGHTEALIELCDIVLTKKAIGGLWRNDPTPSQLLRQPSLPGAKIALA